MANYITIDGGTTNTRISLVKDNEIIDTLKFNVGAGLCTEGNAILKDTVKKGISRILSENNTSEKDITRILASGMITSEFGLYELKHITVPAGVGELHDNMAEIKLGEISEIPFVFIRGVKNRCESLESADMMRGEETELMGILDKNDGECVYILPGSHSKLIRTDENGKITDFTTLLTGEMIAALSKNTILKDAVNLEEASLDEKHLISGFDFCNENGINKTLFKVRVLKNMMSKNKNEVYSFFMGAILHGEISEIIKIDPKKVIIGGKKQIKEATFKILSKKTNAEVLCISEKTADTASTLGVIKIYEH